MFDKSLIDKAYSERPELKKRVWDAISKTPQYTDLFIDIAEYTTELKTRRNTVAAVNSRVKDEGTPVSKKRRLEDSNGDDIIGLNGNSQAWRNGEIDITIQDVSFTIPQRKKLTLELTTVEADGGGLQARNPVSGELEFGIAWKHVEHVICLPVPEKVQRQYTFCVFPQYGDGISTLPEDIEATDPMVWTISDIAPKTDTIKYKGVISGPLELGETYRGNFIRFLNEKLKAFGKGVIEPEEKQFASCIVQSHRKGEKAFHVKAFRGSKDGFLFFLHTGIIFAFKKPLAFFAFETIDSISYTSVLQRTFNLNITTSTSTTPSPSSTNSTSPPSTNTNISKDFEFSMLDQADFAGIDSYIKRHGLQDSSMAEQRRAKKVNVNGVVKGEDRDKDGEGELEKAAKEVEIEMEDREDEEEEDYDPGSEGQSEGEGTSDEEEDEGEGGIEGGEEEGESEL
ncbi:MAG: hypothetical protein M1812_005595 [Candelaria pacifica]|nr:MAG: hypothetical protein M1812_005595 [Candelaria pacifica]